MTNRKKLLDEQLILKQCEDDLFRLALIKLEKKQAAILQAESEIGNDEFSAEDMEATFKQSMPRVSHTIQRELRKQQGKTFLLQTLPRVCKAAACILLVVFLGATTALAVSRTVRVYLMNFLINIEEKYTELGFVTDQNMYVDVPEGWCGQYFMSYIPDGFNLEEIVPGSVLNAVHYMNEKGNRLFFTECASSAYTNIDTEKATITYITINGQIAFQSKKNGFVALTWAYADHYFIIEFDGLPEEARRIAESIIQINLNNIKIAATFFLLLSLTI